MILLYGFALLSLVVLIHELGHFLVGRLFGVKFLSFSIGMGPRLFRFKVLDTPFFISLLPLGGYVRPLALSEESVNEHHSFMNRCYRFLAPVDKEELATLSRYDSGSFENVFNKSFFAQASIILGGVLFNILSVLIAFSAFFYFLLGQRTIYQDVAVLDQIRPKSMADHAGFKHRDRILAVNGEIFNGWHSVFDSLTNSPESQLVFEVLRDSGEDSEILTLKIFNQPSYREMESPIQFLRESGLAPPVTQIDFTLPEAVAGSVSLLSTMSGMILKSVLHPGGPIESDPLLHGARSVGSPVIAMFEIGLVASQDLQSVVMYFGLISLLVAVFNLLPLPILDGGQLVILVLEKVLRIPMSAQRIYAVQRFGFSCVLILTLLLLGKDLFEAWM